MAALDSDCRQPSGDFREKKRDGRFIKMLLSRFRSEVRYRFLGLSEEVWIGPQRRIPSRR
jgi:hypothetical protein